MWATAELSGWTNKVKTSRCSSCFEHHTWSSPNLFPPVAKGNSGNRVSEVFWSSKIALFSQVRSWHVNITYRPSLSRPGGLEALTKVDWGVQRHRGTWVYVKHRVVVASKPFLKSLSVEQFPGCMSKYQSKVYFAWEVSRLHRTY